MSFWVYILASRPGGTLYVGVTNDLIRRIFEHREGLAPGFTKRYGVKMLVYYEQHATAEATIQREKNIKHWSREWKIDLIISMNPNGGISTTILFNSESADVVIAGLDPAIHRLGCFLMDARVNPRRCGGSPAHDELQNSPHELTQARAACPSEMRRRGKPTACSPTTRSRRRPK